MNDPTAFPRRHRRQPLSVTSLLVLAALSATAATVAVPAATPGGPTTQAFADPATVTPGPSGSQPGAVSPLPFDDAATGELARDLTALMDAASAVSATLSAPSGS